MNTIIPAEPGYRGVYLPRKNGAIDLGEVNRHIAQHAAAMGCGVANTIVAWAIFYELDEFEVSPISIDGFYEYDAIIGPDLTTYDRRGGLTYECLLMYLEAVIKTLTGEESHE